MSSQTDAPDYKTLYENAVLQLEALHKVIEVKDNTIELLQKSRDAQAKVLTELELRVEALQNSVRQMPYLRIN
jgi:hypothetical protein